MINTTSQLAFIASDGALASSTTIAIDKAMDIVRPAGTRWSGAPEFRRLFGEQYRITTKRFDQKFLGAALQFCASDSRSTEIGDSHRVIQSYLTSGGWHATALTDVRRGLKLVLVELWSKGAILLPTIFAPGPSFPMRLFNHGLLKWVQGFDPTGEVEGGGKCGARSLYYYGPRIIFAADWCRPRDVSLNELASLHRTHIRSRNGSEDLVTVCGTTLPFFLFAAQLRRSFPGEAAFTIEDLERYSSWSATRSIIDVPFETFTGKPKKEKVRVLRRGDGINAVKKKRADYVTLVSGAMRENTLDAAVRLYVSLRRGRPAAIDWRETDVPCYPGREHVELTSMAPKWIRTFRAFLHHRQFVKEYRTNDDAVASLNLLSDYLFFYLPWWKQICPSGKVAPPESPKDFSRYAFVARHTPAPREELPDTLLELVSRRRPNKDSMWVAVHHLARYFEFVATHFAEDDDVAGRAFKSPINGDFDAPRIKKRNKTTKEVIPKQIYGHLLHYCYAIEDFGQHLQGLAIRGELPDQPDTLRYARRFSCAEFGHVPMVKYRGKEIPLDSVPNVFVWAERELDGGETGESRVLYLPHLSELRLLITSLETGLRCQSVQWLDRFSWDSLNGSAPPDAYTYAFLVNTDKTREHPWMTYVVYRVRDMLRREQRFQESLPDAHRFGPVNYERLENSPFDPIRPLFRAPNSAYPVSDHGYAKTWTELMIFFQEFHQLVTGEQHVRMYRIQPVLNADGTPVVRFLGRNEQTPYCPVSVLAIHTPHACRATFATNRQGILELSEVAILLGHRNEVTTAHYTKPSGEALQERLRESDMALVADYAMFDASSDVHIRADRAESALVRGFSRDRETAVRRFHFMPPIALWSTESTSGEGEGLTLLREGPMSRIRFRETHICPVGEECPADVIEKIGAPKRCGACPLAMKCVDHLPAIAAKKNQLLERIRYLHRRRKMLEESGEPAAVLDELWEELELDINELLGWQVSEEVLTSLLKNIETDDAAGKVLHVDRPEIVRRHLQRVTRSCNGTELLLQRIADSNAYPSLTTPQVQAAAAQLKRRLLAGTHVDEIQSWTGDLDDVRVAARQLALMMKTAGLSVSDVAKMLTVEPAARPEPVLLSQGK